MAGLHCIHKKKVLCIKETVHCTSGTVQCIKVTVHCIRATVRSPFPHEEMVHCIKLKDQCTEETVHCIKQWDCFLKVTGHFINGTFSTILHLNVAQRLIATVQCV